MTIDYRSRLIWKSVVAALTLGLVACEFGGGPGGNNGLPADGDLPLDAPHFPEAGTKKDAGVKHDAPGRLDAKVFKDSGSAVRDDSGSGGSDGGMTGSNSHLLLTEVCLNPDAAAFIEVYNPTGSNVDLTNYYLAVTPSYYQLPLNSETIARHQWIVQFPVASTIKAGQVVTVTPESGFDFDGTYGVFPTYSIDDEDMNPILVDTDPYMDFTGTSVVLFYWDGIADLVEDVDIMIAGAPTTQWQLTDKSGVMQGSSTYAGDANTIAAQAGTPGANTSTKRILFETGNEIQNGMGNGITGHDETSENTAVTWDNTYGAPTPGTVPTL